MEGGILTPNEAVEKLFSARKCSRNALLPRPRNWHDLTNFEFFYSLNVKVTGAARLYRAASSDQRERG